MLFKSMLAMQLQLLACARPEFDGCNSSQFSDPSDSSALSMVCPHWGSAQFDGCNFCRRSRASVRMISDRHHECLSCRAYMRKHHPQSCAGPAKNKYEEKLKQDDSAHETHLQDVANMELAKQNGTSVPQPKATPVKRKRCGDVTVEDEAPAAKLLRTGGRSLEVRECLGGSLARRGL